MERYEVTEYQEDMILRSTKIKLNEEEKITWETEKDVECPVSDDGAKAKMSSCFKLN